MTKRRLRVLAVILMIAVSGSLLTGMLSLIVSDRYAAQRDFIEYWAAGQQLHSGANPYDTDALLKLEASVGLEGNHPRVTWSPPIIFSILWPLGLVRAKTGFILWTVVLLACLSIALGILWKLMGRPTGRLHLLGYLFAPVLCCLNAGQLGIFLLLSVVLFLYFHQSRPFLAGAALLPCAFKPHLFLPFAIVLLLWIVHKKAYRLLFGFAFILLAGCATTLYLDIHAWDQYLRMMRTERSLQMFAPTLSALFRSFVDRNAVWPQFIPEVAGCTWALWYFLTNRSHWKWMNHGMLLLLVSALCTPYAFFTDESMLLPAILIGLYRAVDSRRYLAPLAFISALALVESLKFPLYSLFYLWTVPAWLIWFLYSTRSKNAAAEEIDRNYTEVEESL